MRIGNGFRAQRARGFTLMEVLVAIALMAVMTALGWQGVDSLLRAQRHTDESARQLTIVQTALAQWQRDLEQIALTPVLPPLDWNGQVLRITRHASGQPQETPALQVVAWSQRPQAGQTYWARWQSPPLRDRAQWASAWHAAELWAQGQAGSTGQSHFVLPVQRWQLYYAVEGRWSNPLSSDRLQDVESTSWRGDNQSTYQSLEQRQRLPDAVRLQLHLPQEAGPLSGTISRDWLAPTFGAAR